MIKVSHMTRCCYCFYFAIAVLIGQPRGLWGIIEWSVSYNFHSVGAKSDKINSFSLLTIKMYSLLSERVQKGKNKLAAQRESRAGHEQVTRSLWYCNEKESTCRDVARYFQRGGWTGFRHLNIVCCVLKKKVYKGVTPGPPLPSYALEFCPC